MGRKIKPPRPRKKCHFIMTAEVTSPPQWCGARVKPGSPYCPKHSKVMFANGGKMVKLKRRDLK